MDAFWADLAKIASVFALAFFYFWPAIITGLTLGLPPLVVILVTTLSYASGVAVVVLFGQRVRTWIMARLGKKDTAEPTGRLRAIWNGYGLIGLSLAAPMTIGAQIGAVVGLALNAKPHSLLLALSLGGLLWSILLTLAVSLGILGAQALL